MDGETKDIACCDKRNTKAVGILAKAMAGCENGLQTLPMGTVAVASLGIFS